MFAEAKHCMDGPQRRIGPQLRIGLIRSREQLGESIMLCFEADTTRHGFAFHACTLTVCRLYPNAFAARPQGDDVQKEHCRGQAAAHGRAR